MSMSDGACFQNLMFPVKSIDSATAVENESTHVREIVDEDDWDGTYSSVDDSL